MAAMVGLRTYLTPDEHLYLIHPLSARAKIMETALELRKEMKVVLMEQSTLIVDKFKAAPLYSKFPFLRVTHANGHMLRDPALAFAHDPGLWKPLCFADPATNQFLIDCRALYVHAYDRRVDTALIFQRLLEICNAACEHFGTVAVQIPEISNVDFSVDVNTASEWFPRHFFPNPNPARSEMRLDQYALHDVLARCASEQQDGLLWSQLTEAGLEKDIVKSHEKPHAILRPVILRDRLPDLTVNNIRLRRYWTTVRWRSERCNDSKTQHFSNDLGYSGVWCPAYPETGPLTGDMLPIYYERLGTSDPRQTIDETTLHDPAIRKGFYDMRALRHFMLSMSAAVPRQLQMPCLPFSALEPTAAQGKMVVSELGGAPACVLLNGNKLANDIVDHCFILVCPGMTLSVTFPLSCAAVAWDLKVTCPILDTAPITQHQPVADNPAAEKARALEVFRLTVEERDL